MQHIKSLFIFKRFFLIVVLLVFFSNIIAQKKVLINIDSIDFPIINKFKIDFPKNIDDKLLSKFRTARDVLKRNGYIFNSIDSINNTDSNLIFKLFIGQRIDKFHLISNNSNNIQINSLLEFNQYLDSELKNYNDSGYFLAQISIDTCFLLNKEYQCSLNVKKGLHFTLDSIVFESNANEINIPFIKQILNLDKANVSFNTISELEKRINSINFLEFEEAPYVKITDSLAIIYVKVREQKLNQFNAFVGILPNAYNSKEISITGDVTLSLKNLLKRGIELSLNWQKPQSSSQFLFTNVSVPYLFKTPLGSSLLFSLEKFDTSFVRLIYEIGLNYKINYNQMVTFFYKKQSSSILNEDSSFKITNSLPKNIDYSYSQFGIQYKYSTIDRILFTRKGFILDATTSLGIKNIQKNNFIIQSYDQFGNSYSRLYDSINLTSSIFYLSLNLEKYILLSKRITYKTSILSKMLFSPNTSNNEMYTFGGYRKPRGFDDNSFISPYFITISNEFHFYFSDFFYTNLFIDVTNYKNILIKEFSTLTPIGFGAGISLKTKGGIANVSIAYGKFNDQNIEFKNGKIHFGYVSTF